MTDEPTDEEKERVILRAFMRAESAIYQAENALAAHMQVYEMWQKGFREISELRKSNGDPDHHLATHQEQLATACITFVETLADIRKKMLKRMDQS